jgi:hypothetical protein
MVFVVAGLPACSAVIEQNEQLMRRFRAPIRLPQFSWQEDAERIEFIACLEAFHDVISEHCSVPRFYEDPWAFRCYCATGGLIGYLKTLLSELLVHSVMHSRKRLDLEDFDIAYMNSLYSTDEGSAKTWRPFRIDFQLVETLDVLNAARMIGRSDTARNLQRNDSPLMSHRRVPRTGIRIAR